eukprot:14600041-Alexandrium_andersonii.AAC.1
MLPSPLGPGGRGGPELEGRRREAAGAAVEGMDGTADDLGAAGAAGGADSWRGRGRASASGEAPSAARADVIALSNAAQVQAAVLADYIG